MAYKKCDFVKMGYRKHPVKKANPEKTKKIIKDRKKRESEWKMLLSG